ncbi:signal peptidase complex subunit 1 [Aspergillus lucknowensis]|uniref:Signal peptidase complex subunit 1 n=1 Tax=Aspergillus lucknowensis TaxID=176173 RepID=A0ABR4LPG8_9EURO
MDDILAPIQDVFEGQIDFHGQRITEILSTALLIVSGVSAQVLILSYPMYTPLTINAAKVIAFLTGYIFQDMHITLWVGLVGTLITGLVVIPPWPFYNKHPENWLVPLPGGTSAAGVVVDGVKVA